MVAADPNSFFHPRLICHGSGLIIQVKGIIINNNWIRADVRGVNAPSALSTPRQRLMFYSVCPLSRAPSIYPADPR